MPVNWSLILRIVRGVLDVISSLFKDNNGGENERKRDTEKKR